MKWSDPRDSLVFDWTSALESSVSIKQLRAPQIARQKTRTACISTRQNGDVNLPITALCTLQFFRTEKVLNRPMPMHTRLARAARLVERRVFLKALALGVSLPVAARLGQLATAQATGAQKRMMVLFLPHGIAPEHYNPKVNSSNPTDFALDQTNESTLAPLEPYKKYVNVYQGLQYLGDGQTHEGVVNFLSGYKLADDSGARTSFEHVIGKELGIRPLILGACANRGYGLDASSKVFWNGTAVDPEKNPAAAADRLFGGSTAPTQPSNPDQPNPDLKLRSEILKLNHAELEELHNAVNGLTSERSKLQTHLQSIQAIKARADSALSGGNNGGGAGGGVSSCSTMPNMPLVEQVRAASAGEVDVPGVIGYFHQEANFELLFQAQLQLATQALVCNAAPIVGVQPLYTTCEIDFSFAGTPGSHHSALSHAMTSPAPGYQWDSPPSIDNVDPKPRAAFAKAQRWFTKQLVDHVVSVLATTEDPSAPGSTVLDNTLIYWASEISDGANHLRDSVIDYPGLPVHLPLVTIGSAGGALKTGQVVQLPIVDRETKPNPARPATDLYLTLAKAMGANNATFPDTTGVISEVLA